MLTESGQTLLTRAREICASMDRCGTEFVNAAASRNPLVQIKGLAVRESGYTILAPAAANDRVSRGELLMSRIVEPVYHGRSTSCVIKMTCGAVERITLDVVEDLVRRKIWLVAEPAG